MKNIINEKMLNKSLGNGTLKELEENARLIAFDYFNGYTQEDVNKLGSSLLLKHRDYVSQKYVSIDFIQRIRQHYNARFRQKTIIKKVLFELNDDLSLTKVDEEKSKEILESNSIKSYNQIFQIQMILEEDLDELIEEEDLEKHKFVFDQGKNFDIDNITHYRDSYSSGYDKLYTFIAPIIISKKSQEIFLQQFNIRGYLDMPSHSIYPSQVIEYVLNNDIIKFSKVFEVTSSQEERMNFEYPFIGYVYTNKHKGRFIAPEDGLHQVHRTPAKIVDNFSTSLPELLFRDDIKDLLDTMEGVNYTKLDDGHDILKALKSSKPDAAKIAKRSGAHRFTPLMISEEKLVSSSLQKFFDYMVVNPFNRINSTLNFLDSSKVKYGETLEIDGVSIQVDMSDEVITCPKCKDSIDYTFFGELRGEKKNLEEIKCSCGFINTPSESFLINPEDKYYIFVDKDEKGKIILRSVYLDLTKRYWEDNLDLTLEVQRVVIYTADSSLNPTYYHYNINVDLSYEDLYNVDLTMNKIKEAIKKDDTDLDLLDFETVTNSNYYFNKNSNANSELFQNKMDILQVISDTDYKYSALEDFMFSKKLNRRFVNISSIVDYLTLYKDFNDIEKITRIEDIHPLLKDLLRVSMSNMTSYIDVYNTKTIKDILKLTAEQYSVFLGTNKDREALLVCQQVENQEEYDFLYDNDLSTYTLSLIRDIGELINKKTSTVCEYLLRVDVYQAIEPGESATLLLDYLRMAETLNYDFSSNDVVFPNSLKREHDVASREYNNLKYKKYTEEEEKIVIESLKEFEFEDDNFSVIAPEKLEEIREEGNKQRHCVASYVDSVYQRKTNIMFMRANEDLNKPLYTVEVINHKIVQVRGFANKPVDTLDEKIFVEKYKKFLKELRNKKMLKNA